MINSKKTKQELINKDIDIGIKVIEKEIEGLKSLESNINDNFVNALDLIENLKGKVIVSGMGKSGHIGCKIAATLASTGTPSFFIHPGEASHGDLGMVTKDDLLLLLSNSGETTELSDIINYSKRFRIPLIGIVRRKESQLAKSSDLAFILPEIPEASNINAPTTSTTMMLALGDALAVALLERKNFNKENFKIFHPGGKLGASFLKVKDLMHAGEKIPLANLNDNISLVIKEITSKKFGCVAIVNSEKKIVGVVTDGDLRRNINNLLKSEAKDIMNITPKTTKSDSLATSALSSMEISSITSLFVINNQQEVEGILHIHDLLRAGIK